MPDRSGRSPDGVSGDDLHELETCVAGAIRGRDWLRAWDALYDLAEAIARLRLPITDARHKLEAALLLLLDCLVEAEALRAVDPESARTAIPLRLRKPTALAELIDEFDALVHEILAPRRFYTYLGVERERLSAYLETVARNRLDNEDDDSGACAVVDQVFADLLRKALRNRIWELPRDPERWRKTLARRVRDKARNRNARRQRRAERLIPFADTEPLESSLTAARNDVESWIEAAQEAAVYFQEVREQLSPEEQRALDLKAADYTEEEIAATLNIPLRTLQRILSGVRERFRHGGELGWCGATP